MGYDGVRKQSKTQLQRLIHERSKMTENVVVTVHAAEQMAKRGIASPSVFKCLREGTVRREPEVNNEYGTLECRIERLCGGSEIGVLVAICDEVPTLVVVTAMFIGGKRSRR
jgi:hypothetical protein